jgi:hypothetical protein
MNNLRNRGVEDLLIAVVPLMVCKQTTAGQWTASRAFLTPSTRLSRDDRPDLHRASGAPLAELLRLEGLVLSRLRSGL